MQKLDKDLLDLAVEHLEAEILASNPGSMIELLHETAMDPGPLFDKISQKASRTTLATLQRTPIKEKFPGDQLISAHRMTMLIGVQIGLAYAKLGKKAKA